MWKFIVIGVCLVLVIVLIVCMLGRYNPDPCKRTIMIHRGVDLTGLYGRIVKVHIAISTINKITNPIPLTHEFSHWMVLVKTDQNKHYLISTSPRQCVEIISTSYDDYVKCVMYKYQDNRDCYVKVKGYDVNKVNINVMEYCDLILKHYIRQGKYHFFNNNCHAMTEYGLLHILKVDDAANELKRSYNVVHVCKDILTNNTVFSPNC